MYKILGTVKRSTGCCLVRAQRSKRSIMSRDENGDEDPCRVRRLTTGESRGGPEGGTPWPGREARGVPGAENRPDRAASARGRR